MKYLPGLCAIAIVLGTGFGCSKEPSSETVKAQNPAPVPAAVAVAPLTPFPEIAKYEKKPPNDLVTDPTIGTVIRSIVPQAQLRCMDDIFDHMPDLQLSKEGSVTAESNGSNAESGKVGYVNVLQTGEIDIVIECLDGAPAKSTAYYFTTRVISGKAVDSVTSWYYGTLSDAEVVRISNGKEIRDVNKSDFLKEVSAGAAVPLENQKSATAPIQPPSSVKTNPAPFSGKWSCTNNRDSSRDRITFGSKEEFEFVVNPGGTTESHRQGTYRPNGDKVDVVITKIPELSKYGRSPNISIQETIVVNQQNSNSLIFTQWENSDPSDKIIFTCTKTINETAKDTPPLTTKAPASQATRQTTGEDKVAAYANNLASELERSSHPTCQMLANSIRSFGNSGQPDYVRIRQVDNLFNKAPSICVR